MMSLQDREGEGVGWSRELHTLHPPQEEQNKQKNEEDGKDHQGMEH